MKKNSKIVAILLILIMTLSVCACGKKDKAEEKKTEQNTTGDATTEEEAKEEKEAKVGAILDAPEKIFNLEEFYIYFTYPDETNEAGISTMEIAMNDTEEPGILYVSDGLLKTNETVYELDGEGNVAKYEKNVFVESFQQDKTLSKETLAQEKDDMLVLLQTLGFCFVDANSGVQFKKCENQKAVLTGDVYVYEMLQDGESLGEVWVDQETGVFVKWTDKNGEEAFSVQEIKTSDIDIPEYK